MSENAVLFTVTGRDIQLTGTAIALLVLHWPENSSLVSLVMADDYLKEDIFWLKSSSKQRLRPNITVDVWQKPSKMEEGYTANTNTRYPLVVLWRLFAPYILVDTDRLLYQYNDVLICDDIRPMFDMLPDDKAIGAENDCQTRLYADTKEGQIWPEKKHFDSYFKLGVLLINTHKYS